MQKDSLAMKIYKRVTKAAVGMIAGAATGTIVGAINGGFNDWQYERIIGDIVHGSNEIKLVSYSVFNTIGLATFGAVSIAILGAILGPIFLKHNVAKLGMVLGWVGGLIIGIITEEIYLVWVSYPFQTFKTIFMYIMSALTGAVLGALVAGEIKDRFSARVIGRFEGAVIGVIIGAFAVECTAEDGAMSGAILAGIVGVVGALEPRD